MALAKYLEDISDRFWEDQEAMGRLEAAFAPGTYVVAPPLQSGWIRLALDSGPLPDRIALVKDDAPRFQIELDHPDAPFEVAFVSGPPGELPHVSVTDQQAGFTVAVDGLYLLRVSCGSYARDYEIDVTGTLDLDRQEPIEQGYLYLQDRPDEWTRERLDGLRRLMIPANRPAGVPDSFCNGILDYHLGLFHAEQDNLDVANQRFEDAYRHLRPFIVYSDVARFICDYIQYLMNRFDGCEPGRNAGVFGGLRAFLKAAMYDTAWASAGDKTRKPDGRYFEVLVKSVDQDMLEVLEHLRGSNPDSGLTALEGLESRLQVDRHDVACRVRIQLVLARGFRRLGKQEAASRYYRHLSQTSAASPWHPESNHFLTANK